jgi:hypothetical protein
VEDHNAGSAPRQTLGARRLKMRVMHRTSVGIVAVYEQDPASTDGKRALVFESSKVCTRVVEFPDEWQQLTDEELTAIRHRDDH